MKPLFYIHIATAMVAMCGLLFNIKIMCNISCVIMLCIAVFDLLHNERKEE